MQPFSRETIIDRRQPVVRWSAVLAGAGVALGTWLLLQLLGSAVALYALDADELDRARGIGIGSTAWSVFAVMVAMFLGGLLASRLAGHHERRAAGLHGVLAWAITAIVGFVAISASLSSATSELSRHVGAAAPEPGDRAFVDRALAPVNAKLMTDAKPLVHIDDVIGAAHDAITIEGYDLVRFADKLDERSPLTRAEVDGVVNQLGAYAPEVMAAAHRIGEHRAQATRAAEAMGCMFLVATLALALGLLCAIGGALVSARALAERRSLTDEPRHTAPYGVPVQHPADVDITDVP